MSIGFLCICVYDLHLKKVNIKENCKWSIYAPHMSELPHLNFHFEFVINLIYSINQINLYGSYNEDTLGLFSIRLIFTPINSYGLYMRYYEKWSEIARADSTILGLTGRETIFAFFSMLNLSPLELLYLEMCAFILDTPWSLFFLSPEIPEKFKKRLELVRDRWCHKCTENNF